jgi:hypothetical protein
MNVLTYKTESNSDEKTGVILRTLERLICEYKYVVPNGWRFIMKMRTTDSTEPYYHLDVQSNRGGGSFAEVKMVTLESHDIASTGSIDLLRLVEIIEEGYSSDSCDVCQEILGEVRKLENASQMSKQLAEKIRDTCNVTPFHGGIRIPYEDLIINGNETSKETGEILLSFSGASQEQDIFFALSVFRAMNEAFPVLYPNTQGWLNLRELEKIPVVKFWLNALGIEEA